VILLGNLQRRVRKVRRRNRQKPPKVIVVGRGKSRSNYIGIVLEDLLLGALIYWICLRIKNHLATENKITIIKEMIFSVISSPLKPNPYKINPLNLPLSKRKTTIAIKPLIYLKASTKKPLNNKPKITNLSVNSSETKTTLIRGMLITNNRTYLISLVKCNKLQHNSRRI